jgi:hypothetical protein
MLQFRCHNTVVTPECPNAWRHNTECHYIDYTVRDFTIQNDSKQIVTI